MHFFLGSHCKSSVFAFVLGATSLGWIRSSAAIDLDPVMLQFQAVPGTSGFFLNPSVASSGINNSRQVVTWNNWQSTSGFEYGVFLWENGVLTDVLRGDDVANAPGIGQPVVSTQPGFLDHNGNIAIPASFGDPQRDVNVIGPNRAGLALVNRVGGANAPGNNGPWLPFVQLKGNNTGQMVFYGSVGNNNLGLWRGTSAALLVRLVQEDVTLVPGTAELVQNVAFETPLINNTGLALFDVDYGATGDEEAVLIGRSDADLQVLARTNSVDVPGLPAGTKYSRVQKESLNNAGHAVFTGGWNGLSESGLFTTVHGLVQPIALSSNTPMPCLPGEVFGNAFSSVAISGDDKVFFTSVSDVGGTTGVFKWDDGVLSSLALEGQTAPGTSSTFDLFYDIHTNATGDMMFFAELEDGNKGIWFIPAGTNTLLTQLVTGMNADVFGDGTDIRPISDITMSDNSGGPQGGDNIRFNDHGEFIVSLSFDAGSNTRPIEGLYISKVVPEPGACMMALMACAAAYVSRRGALANRLV